MAQQLLNGANIIASFQQMGGKTVPKRMGGDMFGNARFLGRLFYCLLHAAGVKMMPVEDTIVSLRFF